MINVSESSLARSLIPEKLYAAKRGQTAIETRAWPLLSEWVICARAEMTTISTLEEHGRRQIGHRVGQEGHESPVRTPARSLRIRVYLPARNASPVSTLGPISGEETKAVGRNSPQIVASLTKA